MKRIIIGIGFFLVVCFSLTAQQSSQPIGVFDSGTGGLTVLNTIITDSVLAKEKYIYLADQANMPYGNYHSENKDGFLIELIHKDVDFLVQKNVKAIVVACNTATAYGLDKIKEKLAKDNIGLKVIGVIDAGAKGALDVFKKNESGSIGVFATVGTVASMGYEKTLERLKKEYAKTGNIQIYNQGGLGIAESIDEDPDYINHQSTSPLINYRGPSLNHPDYAIHKTLLDVYDFDFDNNQMLCDAKNINDCQVMQINSPENYIRYHLVSMMEKIRKTPGALPLKALILGCTHYPYLKKEIIQTFDQLYNFSVNGKYIYRPFMQKKIEVIDPAENLSRELSAYLRENALLNTSVVDTLISEFYITVPNKENKNVQLDSLGKFSYQYKYGRKTGQFDNDVLTVPFNKENVPLEIYERFSEIIPATSLLIETFQQKTAIQYYVSLIDSIYKDYASKIHSPGMIYAVVAGDKIIHYGEQGWGNVEAKYSVDRHTAFRVASMTKSFVGMAILQLRDNGKIRLDDPAYLYIPELKKQPYIAKDAPAITIKHLLSHAAGFPEDNPWGDRQLGISDEEMLSMIKKGISFSNTPGVVHEYSNMGFAMLGYIIKKVTGKTYEQYITDNILKPLGMNNTYFEYADVPEKKLALGYRYVNGGWVKQPILHDGAYGAMGGLITTMEDFRKYVSFHLKSWNHSYVGETAPLKRSSVREMDGPVQFASLNADYKYPGGRACPTVTAYGYGIRWFKDCDGKISLGHSGGLPGYGSNWTILPDYGIGVIAFFNITYAPGTAMNAHMLDEIVHSAKLKPRPVQVPAILKQRKEELTSLLPDWKNAEASGIFADNFFLDYFIDSLKKEAKSIYNKAGKIISVSEFKAVNHLRGSFTIHAENGDIVVWFTLNPENPPLIQEYKIRFEKKLYSHLNNAFNYTPVKDVIAKNGVVVSAHTLASEVGLNMLQKGGNAIDAAIATQLALAVVYPNAGNIGGGGFLVARLANNKNIALDYREKAPSISTRDMYLDHSGNPIDEKSMRGVTSSGVPGTVAGLFESLQYASLSFDELIEPAILLAEKGFAISLREANALNKLQDEFTKYNSIKPAFVRQGLWKEGDTLIQTDLAETLKRIKKEGKKGFYEGETARLIVEEMKRGGGYISLDDLKNYQAIWRSPHSFNYKGFDIISMPPPSSGGILIHQMLKMIENRSIETMGPLSLKSIQLMAEVERRAYADRARYMGDPDYFNVPVNAITDSLYLVERMKKYVPGKAGKSKKIQPGKVKGYESEETTHISIIDKYGNAVAITTTLNDSYGSRTVVGGAGFLLNDEMDDFSVKPGSPNMYGAVGGEANAIEAGKRMLSSMTPTIVLKNNQPFLVLGTPGGTTIPTSVFQSIVNILDFGLSPRKAIDLPKFHHQWLPDKLFVEPTLSHEMSEQLTKIGYEIHKREAIGRTEIIKVLPDGSFCGAADKRGEDSAAGY